MSTSAPNDACAWCRGPVARRRSDARYCSQRCRQASHRFGRHCIARARAASPLRLAYADPPYPKLAHRYYSDRPDYAGEVDHAALLERLRGYDGWALSTSARALPHVLSIAVAAGLDVRVAAWLRGYRPNARARHPISSWEPVIYAGGREIPAWNQRISTEHVSQLEACDAYFGDGSRLDSLMYIARPRTTDAIPIIGRKPAAFAYWMFDLLGALPGDSLDDLFPGSGGIARAWDRYSNAALEGTG